MTRRLHPCAIITGAAGQDGSYLTECLLEKGYIVFGMVRRSSNMRNFDRISHLKSPFLHVVYGDVTDFSSITTLLNKAVTHLEVDHTKPIEVYNLAAQSHVKVSFEVPIYTAHVDAIGTLNMLEAIVQLNLADRVRFYQASTSELYGNTLPPQNESSPMIPQSPYAIAKQFSFNIVKNYREAYGIFAVNGILFNHESERRAENFVTRKITQNVAKRYHGSNTILRLGNLYSKRDWGYAKDFINAMWLMLQQSTPEDFVIATGQQHSIKDFVMEAFAVIGIVVRWEGTGLDEKGYDQHGNLIVEIDPTYFRPIEVDSLQGDASKANNLLGWSPTTCFKDLVKHMVEHDIRTMCVPTNIES